MFLKIVSRENVVYFCIFSFVKLGKYHCDCHMVWVTRRLRKTRPTNFKGIDDMRCTSPRRLHYKKVVDLDEKDICPLRGLILNDTHSISRLSIYKSTIP